MVAAHCAGSLRSLTVINGGVSRWETEENANKNVCSKESFTLAPVSPAEVARAFHAMMDLFSDPGFWIQRW